MGTPLKEPHTKPHRVTHTSISSEKETHWGAQYQHYWPGSARATSYLELSPCSMHLATNCPALQIMQITHLYVIALVLLWSCSATVWVAEHPHSRFTTPTKGHRTSWTCWCTQRAKNLHCANVGSQQQTRSFNKRNDLIQIWAKGVFLIQLCNFYCIRGSFLLCSLCTYNKKIVLNSYLFLHHILNSFVLSHGF